jgi:signal transduction histidine kinase
VSISLTLQDRDAIAQIRDTGIGIAEQDLPHIFDRFYQVNSDRSRTTGGSGLGLAIAKAIANKHRYNIQVTSELGKGSKFIVVIAKI